MNNHPQPVWSQPTTSSADLQRKIVKNNRLDSSTTSASLSATIDAAADPTKRDVSGPSSGETSTTGRRLLLRNAVQSQLDRLVDKMVRISRQNHDDSRKDHTGKAADHPPEKNANDLIISGDFYLEKGRLIRRHGLNWLVAALFIVADMAGGGIVALPTAIVRCSFTLGLVLLLLMAVLATSSSILLGKAWVILLRLYPQYRTHCRKPYAEIGYRAFGPRMKTIVSICLNVTQFGASTVFLLLIAKNSDDFLRAAFGIDIGMCLMIVVVALILLPITLLKSPQDFWVIVVLGMASTGIAVALVCVGATIDHDCFSEHRMPPLQLPNVLIALGTIMFTFGGHSALPTIQHDMRRPAEFGKSSILAFTLITGMNLIAVLFGGLTYGDSLRSSVINSIQTVWIQQAINLMILAHCLLTFTLIINPLNQEIEEYFNVSQGFGVSRVIVRMIMMALAGLMAATVPNFDSILSLIGGLAFTLISMTFPCLFYLYLSAADKRVRRDAIAVNGDDGTPQQGAATVLGVSECSSASTPCCMDEYCSMSFIEMVRSTEPQVLFMCGIICLVGAASGAIATIMAVKAIATGQSSSFSQPCYAKLFSAAVSTSKPDKSAWSSLAVTNCCGTYQNVSLHNSVCTQPDFEFYRS